jgi:predicted  nucleic acid-binding Zn-ribbon protein
MANLVPAGSDVSAGTCKCTNCGYDLQVASTELLPPCPSCGNGEYATITGGDSANDAYSGR